MIPMHAERGRDVVDERQHEIVEVSHAQRKVVDVKVLLAVADLAMAPFRDSHGPHGGLCDEHVAPDRLGVLKRLRGSWTRAVS
jgi:hypothetical protein